MNTISFVTEAMPPRDAYRLLISSVVPRPIGWASTVGADGSINLAPFSFFNAVGGPIPFVMISVSRRAGAIKDTLRNVTETGEMVLNIVSEELAPQMNITSGDWAYGENEFERAGLEAAPSVDVRPPRVAAAPVAMEVKVTQIVPVEGSSYTMIIGRVVRFHVRRDLLRPDGTVDPVRLNPVARLGGDEYARLGEVFTLPRPKV
ncbi:MAG: flavin reductase family protein [Roseiflexus sp.]|nr:flavin reductase family protein [Roseiflexus sp.]MCS7289692.1 flavin reductase family protein [Roseiflexus sp.]MDW8148719.1 flavin reductase family protein [Roseiflexaceae bacterium]MDW8232379.1 flavin reductase family protein [Roseiflexaceae bacterium]